MHQGTWCFIMWSHINIIGKLSAEHSWGDVKIIKYGTISAIIGDISEKQSAAYIYACFE